MTEKELIDTIIDALKEKNAIMSAHKYQGGKAVQVKTRSGDYYNITAKRLPLEAHIADILKD